MHELEQRVTRKTLRERIDALGPCFHNMRLVE